MTIRIPAPRLLPFTIGILALVLVAKSTILVRTTIIPALTIATAWAAGPETPAKTEPAKADKPAVKPGEPAKPDHAAENKPAAALSPNVSDGPAPVTDAERAVLLELRDRRKELDARDAVLSDRESMLAAAEQKLSARVEELQALQKRLETLDAGHRQQEDAAWQGLVKVYETMKPRDAATIFNDLGMQVLLAVVGRMKEAKAAAILAAMLPDKARDVTMQLAQSRSKAANAVDIGDKQAEPGKAPGSGT
jgi:flagellar motility protein MotE (MotC chaperone)